MPPATSRPAFVGRETERQELLSTLSRAREGEAQCLFLSGEPGIGKTALCQELTREVVADGGLVLSGNCYEEETLSVPYLPLVEVIRDYVAQHDSIYVREMVGGVLADIGSVVPQILADLDVEALAPTSPEEASHRLLQGMVRLLEKVAERQLTIVIVEDLHDADQGTLDLLVYITRRLGGTRLVPVATFRDTPLGAGHPLLHALVQLQRAPTFRQLRLRGMEADDVAELVVAYDHIRPSPTIVAATVRHTGGNPLFVLEVARYLSNREDDDVHVAEAIARIVPGRVSEAIGVRLAGLSASCRKLLAAAAVIGLRVDTARLARVADMTGNQLRRAMGDALAARILIELPLPGGGTYRFSHSLFRRVLYDQTPTTVRGQLHRAVAEALTEAHRQIGDSTEDPELTAELAEHLSHSLERGDLEQAVDFFRAAGRHSLAVFGYSDAARFFERALWVQRGYAPEDQNTRCELLLDLAVPLLQVDPEHAVDTVLPEAAKLADALDDKTRALRASELALAGLHKGHPWDWDTPIERELAWARLGVARAAAGGVGEAAAPLRLANVQFVAADFDDAAALVGKALAIAEETNQPSILLHAFGGVAAGLWAPLSSPSQWPQLRQLAAQLAGVPRDSVDQAELSNMLLWCANVSLASGDRETAEDLWRYVEALSERTDESTILSCAAYAGMTRAYLDGDLRACVRIGEAGAAALRDAGAEGLAYQVSDATSRPRIYLGWPGRPSYTETSSPLASGDSGAHEAEVRDRLEPRRAYRMKHLPTLIVTSNLDVALFRRDADWARQLRDLLQPAAMIVDSRPTPLAIPRLLGEASALSGEPEAALSQLSGALSDLETIGHRPEVTMTQLALAELLLAYPALGGMRNAGASASEHLAHTRTALASMEAVFFDERLEALSVTNASRQSGAARLESVTLRELAVLRSLADGWTNQEIAARMSISKRTVDSHLSNVYVKIGVANRAEAVAFALRNGLAE